jgi:peptidoglycan hydrolase CwlO-like protein
MYKYEEKINEVGGIENLSKGIKSLIRDFKKAEKFLQQEKQKLKEATDEEEIAEIQKEIEETIAALEEGDDEIVKKVESYMRNKDGYEERMKVMRAKRDAALAEKGLPPVNYKDKTVNTPAPQSAPVAPVTVAAAPAPVMETVITKSGGGETQVLTENPIVEEKKASGMGNMILWGALGFAGILIGVNLFKNRN